MKLDLEQTKILIIEDFSAARSALKEMLYSLTAWDMQEAANAETALNLLRKNKFEIIICDYNLGEGKSGQQVLEEAKHHKLLSLKAIFIMVTAEQSQSSVLGAVETKPDDYLTKPFTAQQLTMRLQRCFEQKQYLYDIEIAIQNYQYVKAIELCNALLGSVPKKIQTLILKYKADLCMLINDYPTANKIYQDTLEQRELPWALMGLGKIHFLQGDSEKSINYFQNVISHNPMILEAYDWIAKIHEQTGDLESARSILMNATELSSVSITRLRKLADNATLSGINNIAQTTYETIVKHSKYSMHRACTDYYKLAKLQATENTAEKALATLNEMRSEFFNNPEAELSIATLQYTIYQQQGNENLAKESYKQMSQLSHQMNNNLDKELALDVIKVLLQNGEQEKANKILDNLIHKHLDDARLMDNIINLYKEINVGGAENTIENIKQKLIRINNEGISLFKQGNIKNAITFLESAEKNMPGNKTIITNLIKIMVKDLQTSDYSDKKMNQIQHLIEKALKLGVAEEKLNLIRMELSSLQQETELS